MDELFDDDHRDHRDDRFLRCLVVPLGASSFRCKHRLATFISRGSGKANLQALSSTRLNALQFQIQFPAPQIDPCSIAWDTVHD